MSETDLKFDDSRIKHYHNKKLLGHVKDYFATFTHSNPDAMKSHQTDDYTISDIPLCIVKANRETWYNINKAFVSGVTDTKVTALSLYGSSEPGHFACMENLVSFKLTSDPAPGAGGNLPPGAKAGDTVQMIMLSVLWWNAEYKITKELEYGRLTWEGFSLDAYDHPK